MSATSIAKPHKHAEVIKQWADNPSLHIECRRTADYEWRKVGSPVWHEDAEYRVKPEKVYPVTQMSEAQLCSAVPTMHRINPAPSDCEQFILDGFRSLANAALRHAIEAGQVTSMADHQDALITLGRNLQGIEIARHAARDMAIAEAVRDACRNNFKGGLACIGETTAYGRISNVSLAAIIAKVQP